MNPDLVRVGILTKTLGRGGAEMLILEQLREGLSTGRCSYSVGYFSSQESALADEISILGVPVTAVARNEIGLVQSATFRNWMQELDVVHVHSPLPASVLRLLDRLTFRRHPHFVYTEHGMWDAYRRLPRTANRFTLPLWRNNFVVSHRAHRSMSEFSRRHAEVLHHGVASVDLPAASEKARIRADLGIPANTGALVNVANATPAKNLKLLVDLAIRMSEYDCSIWHIGGGPQIEAIRAYAAEQGSPLHFLGALPGVRDVLPAFDGFVLTSDSEGLPVAVMEAISAALPVATTDCGGVTELVEHEVNGLVSGVGDLDALAKNCISLLQPQKQQQLSPGVASAAMRVDRRAFVDTLEHRYLTLCQSTAQQRETA